VGAAVGDGRHDRAGVAVADEHGVFECLVVEQADDVGDVRLEVDRRRREGGAIGESGQRQRMDIVPGGRETAGDVLPDPGAEAGAGDEYERPAGRRRIGRRWIGRL